MINYICRCETETHARGLCNPCYHRHSHRTKRLQLQKANKICATDRLYRVTGVMQGAVPLLDYAQLMVPVIVSVYAADGIQAIMETVKHIARSQDFAYCEWVDSPLIEIVPEAA